MSTKISQKVVSTLPRQLLSFFKRHPPASATSWAAPASAATATNGIKSPANPFLSTRNTYTLKFNEPRYSIRRQTDLYNLATLYNIQQLLPPRAAHKEAKTGDVMKSLKKWKGTKMERTRDARIAAIKTKTATASKVIRARRVRTKAKKRAQRTGLISD